MPQVSIRVEDCTNMPSKMQDILAGAKRGVTAATESGVEWIKEEVMEGLSYVVDEFYPDVKPETKQYKAEKGEGKVGIYTGNLKASFDSSYERGGLTGIITGGGGKAEAYSGYFFKRWQIDALFLKERGERKP